MLLFDQMHSFVVNRKKNDMNGSLLTENKLRIEPKLYVYREMITKSAHISPPNIGSMWIAFVLSLEFGQKGFIKNIGLAKTMGSFFIVEEVMGDNNLIK